MDTRVIKTNQLEDHTPLSDTKKIAINMNKDIFDSCFQDSPLARSLKKHIEKYYPKEDYERIITENNSRNG